MIIYYIVGEDGKIKQFFSDREYAIIYAKEKGGKLYEDFLISKKDEENLKKGFQSKRKLIDHFTEGKNTHKILNNLFTLGSYDWLDKKEFKKTNSKDRIILGRYINLLQEKMRLDSIMDGDNKLKNIEVNYLKKAKKIKEEYQKKLEKLIIKNLIYRNLLIGLNLLIVLLSVLFSVFIKTTYKIGILLFILFILSQICFWISKGLKKEIIERENIYFYILKYKIG